MMMRKMSGVLMPLLMLGLSLSACNRGVTREDPSAVDPMSLPFEDRPIDAQKMLRAFPSEQVGDPGAWARDLNTAMDAIGIYPTTARTCLAAAVIDEGSDFTIDPKVPDVEAVFEAWYQEQVYRFGEEDRNFTKALYRVFNTAAEGQSESFKQRILGAETESEIWGVLQELVETFENAWPRGFEGVSFDGGLGELEAGDFYPYPRMGCMQVSVKRIRSATRGNKGNFWEGVYTREGCLTLGVDELLGSRAPYDDPRYILADFHASPFASRNAAFQAQVTALTGRKINPDGKLLIYEGDGDVSMRPSSTMEGLLAFRDRFAIPLSQTKMTRDLVKETSPDFESSSTWRHLKDTYRAEKGVEPDFGQMPQVPFQPPGAVDPKTVAWYATQTAVGYNECVLRMGR